MSTKKPARAKRKPEVKIHNWKFPVQNTLSSLACLYGEVEGHPKHSDGTCVTTTAIIDVSDDLKKATTYNTIYLLQEPEMHERELSLKTIERIKEYWRKRNGGG